MNATNPYTRLAMAMGNTQNPWSAQPLRQRPPAPTPAPTPPAPAPQAPQSGFKFGSFDLSKLQDYYGDNPFISQMLAGFMPMMQQYMPAQLDGTTQPQNPMSSFASGNMSQFAPNLLNLFNRRSA